MRSSFLRRSGGKDPIIFMVVALLCAAGLVLYLQHRAHRALDRQTDLIVRAVAEQKASNVLQAIRRKFDGPVFDTLSSVKHPHLVEQRLDLVLPVFARGLELYPQVGRFFLWTRESGRGSGAGEVRFFDRASLSRAGAGPREGARDPAAAAMILERARAYAGEQMIYGAYRTDAGADDADVFVRIFYTDAARTEFFALLGFWVDIQTVRDGLFQTLARDELAEHLTSSDSGPAFALRVTDERGRIVHGTAAKPGPVSVARPFPLVFYPAEDIRSRMAATVEPRKWTLTVTQQGDLSTVYARWQSYAFSGLSVLLIGVSLAFALQARARSAELSRMQSDFVAHVSHQLKTPVSLLSAVVETVDAVRARSPEKLDPCLQIIKMETARLSHLVQHILEFSSLTHGARRFEVELVALGPLVRETVDSFTAALAPTGFRIEVTQSADPTVTADPVAVEQALVNLLDNAIKYSGESRVVSVRVSATSAEAAIEVSDRGVGITPADQARIFGRFYRGTASVESPQGFGLGLAIARQLVAGQRGRIELESAPGKGSTFRVVLPLRDAVTGVPSAFPARPWFARLLAARSSKTEAS